MASETLAKLVTYDDYRHLPDDGKQYQIIEGELYMTPAPTTEHQRILLKLAQLTASFVSKNALGEVLIAPVDVVLSMTDIVQPDIMYVSKKRLNIITKKNVVEAPDLVVEILSEHTETIDRKKKKELYERHGIKEHWIVDPEAKSIEQYVLQKDSYKLRSKAEKTSELHSQVVSDLKILPKDIF